MPTSASQQSGLLLGFFAPSGWVESVFDGGAVIRFFYPPESSRDCLRDFSSVSHHREIGMVLSSSSFGI